MSEVKVNKISPRTNCGTVQLGDSGDTFTIPAGATITNNGTAAGFGATGAASWDTTVKTSGFTAVSGVGYFVNTTGGAISVNLPAGTAGDVVAIKDYARTFDTNAVTLVQNGSDKIGGSTVNSVLETEGIAVTLVFVDSTQGWLVTDSGLQDEAPTAAYITATGGTITTSGDFKIHTFTGPGTFTVCSVGNPFGSDSVDYIVVAGGGSGATGSWAGGGGGGAGGFREGYNSGSYTASPLATTALPVSATGYPITVGGGGPGATAPTTGVQGAIGSNSVFSSITSTGGGGGIGGDGGSNPAVINANGGSGGGASSNMGAFSPSHPNVGTGNTPPVSPPQGNNGGDVPGTFPQAANYPAGGGGGAGAAGQSPVNFTSAGGSGGAGIQTNIDGNSYYWAGGGGGNAYNGTNGGVGGIGGGGGAGTSPGPAGSGSAGAGGGTAINSGSAGGTPNTQSGGNGGTNTGGGGGGAGGPYPSIQGAGGSGIVIVRYKFQ